MEGLLTLHVANEVSVGRVSNCLFHLADSLVLVKCILHLEPAWELVVPLLRGHWRTLLLVRLVQ